MEEKEITISNLSQKTITPKPGASWKAFTVYQIQGNDGKTYETTDQKFYQSLKLGQITTLKYVVETKNVGGKIYTSYKIPSAKQDNSLASTVRIIEEIAKSEARIIDAVRKMIEPPVRLKTEVDDFIDVDPEDVPF